jgi:hypothetical protein
MEMETRYAREEINHTNRTHIPWVNAWGIVTLALYVLYLLFGKWQMLVLVPWAMLPAIGLMIRTEALVRRHWTLYVLKSGEKGITPDGASKMFVLEGNIIGLLLPLVVIVMANIDGWSMPTLAGQEAMGLGDVFFFVGLWLFVQAGKHEPTFK